MNITYTFGGDCKIAALRGVTVTNGEFGWADGKYWISDRDPDVVRFCEIIDGKRVAALIAGKPELEAALAAHKAEKQAITDRLAAMGWPQYQAAQRLAVNAREAYDHASERGYPAKEAAAMRLADEALVAARAQYPLAAAYATAEDYRASSNYDKSALGAQAMTSIESGADPVETVAAMVQAWAGAALRAVQNN